MLQKVRSLPLNQQIGLWVILKFPGSEDEKFLFKSSELANKFEHYASEKIKKDKSNYGRYIGGILSGLSRNKLLTKLSGDRDKQWTLADDVKNDLELYKQSLFDIKTYWIN